MKKRIILILLVIIVFPGLTVQAAASPVYVHDNAGLMSGAEVESLESLAQKISGDTGLDLVILTVDTIGSHSPAAYADDFYDRNGYSDDGILLMLAMRERDWYISTCGTANEVLSGYALDALLDIGLMYFSDGMYYDGFCQVLQSIPYYFEDPVSQTNAAEITAVHTYSPSFPSGRYLLISALIGAAVAAVVLLIMRGMMNSKRRQRSAVDYMTPGSYHLSSRQDIFLYSHISKAPRQQSSTSSNASPHRSSGGRVHGGGGRKF